MILPEGITGLCERRRPARPPTVDSKAFARACHAVARGESGQVEGVEPAGYPRNFHRAILRLTDGTVAALCNAYVPWIGFAAVSDGLAFRFVESATLAARFKDAIACEVLSPSSLEGVPDAESLAKLGAAEREQVRYWRPQRIGDIVFNFWD